MTAGTLPPLWRPSEDLYSDLVDLPHAINIAWHEAMANPERAEQVLSEAAETVRRIALVASGCLRGAVERATRRENAAARATAQAETRIAFALDGIASATGAYLDPHGFYVYLLRESAGKPPIYVGQSTNILSRLGSHMTAPDRRYRVKHIEVLRCKNRRQMDLTEARLIRHFKPELNTMGVDR
jgi:hypothetical protein